PSRAWCRTSNPASRLAPAPTETPGSNSGPTGLSLSSGGFVLPTFLPPFFVMTQPPHGGQIIKSLKATPQGYRAGLTVTFAAHEATQPRDPTDRLAHSGRLLGRHDPLMHLAPERLPFGLAQPSAHRQGGQQPPADWGGPFGRPHFPRFDSPQRERRLADFAAWSRQAYLAKAHRERRQATRLLAASAYLHLEFTLHPLLAHRVPQPGIFGGEFPVLP